MDIEQNQSAKGAKMRQVKQRVSFLAHLGVLGASILLTANVARADVRWNLTTADFQTQPINLLAIEKSAVRYIDRSSIEQSVPLDQVIGLAASVTPARPPAGKMVLTLTDGTKLAGGLTGLRDEQLVFASTAVGEVTFPLKQIAKLQATAKTGPVRQPSGPSKTADTLVLFNGDSVEGVVDAVSPAAVTIKTSAGPSEVPMESIAAIFFAETAGPASSAAKGFRLQLDDGSTFAVDAITVQNTTASLTLPGGANRTLDLDRLTSIEQIDGPARWLSTMTPSENAQIPFLDTTLPARMNQSVTGGPIMFGQRTFARGIGVHSRSRLTWPLDGTYKSFRTQYAIDGNLPYADVDVRILLDDKVVHEAKGVKAKVLSPVVTFDLGQAKSITLEVDFGQGYDVQDRLNWIEPALLRTPAPPARLE